LYRLKASVARYYRPTYKRIIESILKGHVVHVDETVPVHACRAVTAGDSYHEGS
jgi:hypothetical protein